jgi:hypothetical protein
MTDGIELPLLYAAVVTGLALVGSGRYSLDALLGLTPLWTPAVTWTAVLVGLIGGLGNLALRHVPGRQEVVA